MRLPTVEIKGPKGKGKLVINEADFDPKKHKKYEPPKEKDEEPEEAPKK
jgi:hypothetical protein